MPAIFSLSDITHNTFEKHISAQPVADAVGGWRASTNKERKSKYTGRVLGQPAPELGSDLGESEQVEEDKTQANRGGSIQGDAMEDRKMDDETMADWAEHWPFPHFGLDGPVKEKKSNRHKDSSKDAKSRKKKNKRVSLASSAFAPGPNDSASEASSLSEDEFVQLVTPHPLSSDWNLTYTARKRGILSYSNASTSSVGDGAGGMQKTVGSAYVRTQGSAPTVTKDEVTALIATFDRFNTLGAGFAMRHMDLGWMVHRGGTGARKSKQQQQQSTPGLRESFSSRKSSLATTMTGDSSTGNSAKGTIVRPAVHLNLGNIANALNSGHVRERQVLVNSPRSAILLLRHGVSLDELKKDLSQSALAAETHKTKLSWAERRAIATEEVRQKKLEAIVAQYHSICEQLSLDAIVNFCQQLDPAHPSSALKLTLSDCPKEANNSTFSQSPAKTSKRPASSTITTVSSTGEYLNGKARSLARLQRMEDQFTQMEIRQRKARTTQHELEIQRRRYVVGVVTEKEERAQSALQEKTREHEVRRTISAGQAELWKTQNTSHNRVEKFRTLITSQRSQRRLDEVIVLQTEDRRGAEKFQDTVRRRRVKEAERRTKESVQYLRDARRDFLEKQK